MYIIIRLLDNYLFFMNFGLHGFLKIKPGHPIITAPNRDITEISYTLFVNINIRN